MLKKNKNIKWIALAVIGVVLIGFFVLKTSSSVDDELGTYEDPKEALEETKKILGMVSELLNKGKVELVYLTEFEKTTNKLIKKK